MVAERLDPTREAIPVADRALVDAHSARQVAGHQVGDLPRVEALGQLAAHVQQAAQLAGEILAAGQEARRLECGRSVVGEDGQEPQVVGVEAVEAQLREVITPIVAWS